MPPTPEAPHREVAGHQPEEKNVFGCSLLSDTRGGGGGEEEGEHSLMTQAIHPFRGCATRPIGALSFGLMSRFLPRRKL